MPHCGEILALEASADIRRSGDTDGRDAIFMMLRVDAAEDGGASDSYDDYGSLNNQHLK